MVTKRDITLGKLAVKNSFMTPHQMKEVLDSLQNGSSTSDSFVAEARAKGYIEEHQASAITLACERMERDVEKMSRGVTGYEIISKIGEGGLGIIYKALQKSMNRIVALKILHRRWLDDEEFRKRFLLEARLMGKLSHPNLINVYDVGKEGWKYYFSMEYIKGVSVEQILHQQDTMDIGRAIDIIKQVAKALNYLKEQGIVHCDIKPGNILLTRDDIAKLGDFGFARIRRDLDRQVEEKDSVLGTPEYISPEQALGKKNIDWRSDIYSLGVTLYHMVTGRPPYEGPSGSVMQKHVKGNLPDPRTLNDKLGDELCSCLEKMMARHPSDRYESIEVLLEDLAVARMAEDPRGPDAGAGKTTILSALKREKFLTGLYSKEAKQLEAKASSFKLYFFIVLAILALSLAVNVYIFLRLLEK